MATTGNFIRDAIVAKSDQLNADALIAGNLVIKITAVRQGNKEQPVVIHYEGDNGQPFKPCKSMVRLIAAVWGLDAQQWVGRHMELYLDPTVMYGGIRVGGIRIKSMSHIDKTQSVMLTKTRGKKAEFVVSPLQTSEKPEEADRDEALKQALSSLAEAANQGSADLRHAWRALSEQDRQLFDDGKCPQKIKAIAQAADDAANAENSNDDSGCDQE